MQVTNLPDNTLDDDAGTPLATAMRGNLRGINTIVAAMWAGNATLTLVSRKTGSRLTFKFQTPKGEQGDRKAPVWVRLLSGPDNEGDFTFLGTLRRVAPATTADEVFTEIRYTHSAKSPVTTAAQSVRAIVWLAGRLTTRMESALEDVEVWHEGRCCRCGRKLTVPASIATGMGPECASK